jgi:hypothetical protein
MIVDPSFEFSASFIRSAPSVPVEVHRRSAQDVANERGLGVNPGVQNSMSRIVSCLELGGIDTICGCDVVHDCRNHFRLWSIPECQSTELVLFILDVQSMNDLPSNIFRY